MSAAAPGPSERDREGGPGKSRNPAPLTPSPPNSGISGPGKGFIPTFTSICLNFSIKSAGKRGQGGKPHLVSAARPQNLGFWGWKMRLSPGFWNSGAGKGAYPSFRPSVPLSVHENHGKTGAGRKICLVFLLYVEDLGTPGLENAFSSLFPSASSLKPQLWD